MNELTAMTSLCKFLTCESSLAHRPELTCPPCRVRCSFAFVVIRVKLSLLPANSTLAILRGLRRMGTIIGKGLRPLQKIRLWRFEEGNPRPTDPGGIRVGSRTLLRPATRPATSWQMRWFRLKSHIIFVS